MATVSKRGRLLYNDDDEQARRLLYENTENAFMTTAKPGYVVSLTPVGRGAIATLLVEGPGAAAAVAALFRPAGGKPAADLPIGRIVFGRWGDSGDGTGEELIVCRRSPCRIEVHCHGGKAARAAIVDSLARAGFQELDWRDWVRATESDPIAAEARIALAGARTERTAGVLLDQYRGALGRETERICSLLRSGQSEAADEGVGALLGRAALGRHLTRPWRVVLAGRPNVGKSSLVNAMVGYRRAIVCDMPGTTRDVLTAATAVGGWPVELADTAGLSGGESPERLGAACSGRPLDNADLVVLVFDATRGDARPGGAFRDVVPEVLPVYNKCDLIAPERVGKLPGLGTSAATGKGMAELLDAVAERLVPDPPPSGAAVPFTEEQIEALRFAEDAIAGGDLAAAAGRLRDMVRRAGGDATFRPTCHAAAGRCIIQAVQ